MSYCPRPPKKTKTAYSTPATKTVNAPPPRTEACAPASTTVVTGGGSSTSNTIYVPGPAGPTGPAGPAGANGTNGLGFFWRGSWGTGATYEKQEVGNPAKLVSDVVSNEGCTFICIQDHTADSMNEPHHSSFVGPTNWTDYWSLVANRGADGAGALPAEDQDFFDSLKDDVFDWVKNATLGEIVAGAVAAAGIIWAGAQIVDMFTDDGAGDGQADSRFTGSDGYVTTGYVAPDIKDVIAELCEYAGIAYDVSQLPNEPCEVLIGQTTTVDELLKMLALAYQFDRVDTSGTVKFVPRSATAVKTLTMDEIGFSKMQSNSRYTSKRFQGIDLPRSVTVNYISPDTDYNKFTQVAQLPTFDAGQDIQIDLSLTLSHEKAKQIAETVLVQAHVERNQHAFTTTYKHVDLELADVIDSPLGLVRVTEVNERDEGLIEFTVTDAGVEAAIAASDLAVATPPTSTNVPASMGYSQGLFVDPTALNSSDTGVRVYAAVHGYDAPGWPGATIFVSNNGGASYEQVKTTSVEATVGLVEVAVPSADYHVWDETTTITVKLKTNLLTSASETAVLNGTNWCMIGQEIIGFRTATLTAPKTYTLSGLLRGRRGTEQFVGSHQANELFVMLDSLTRIDFTMADRTTNKKFKVVTKGSSLDKVTAVDVNIQSNNLRAWTVENPKILKVGNDYQLSFGERVRYDNLLKDYSELTHDADWAGFGIAVYQPDGVTLVKTYTTTSEFWTYTSAMQTTDFGSLQASLKTQVVQLSQLGVPGYPVSLNS